MPHCNLQILQLLLFKEIFNCTTLQAFANRENENKMTSLKDWIELRKYIVSDISKY